MHHAFLIIDFGFFSMQHYENIAKKMGREKNALQSNTDVK